jgi:hypothetical protein
MNLRRLSMKMRHVLFVEPARSCRPGASITTDEWTISTLAGWRITKAVQHLIKNWSCKGNQLMYTVHLTTRIGKTFTKCYTWQIFYRQRVLCRVFFRTLGKDFAECRKTLGIGKTLGKLTIEKTQKHNKTFFLKL